MASGGWWTYEYPISPLLDRGWFFRFLHMRTGSIIILLLGLNLAGLFVLLERTRAKSNAPEASPSPRKSSFQALREKTREMTSELAPPAATNTFRWSQLESEDYRTYITRLRRIGCPEQTIRDIVIADLDKLMAAEVREIEAVNEAPKYWQPENKELVNVQAALEKLELKQKLDFEKRQIISDLLGVDLAAERLRRKGERDLYSERLNFLPEAKLARVRMIMEAANREELRIRESSWLRDDQMSESDKARLREITDARERQVAAILTPEEMERFNLWFSPSAYKVREAFFTLEPTEEEWLSIYHLQRAFDEEWGDIDPDSPPLAEKQPYEAARSQLEEDIRQQLGPDRWREFKQARDHDFRELSVTAAQFNLPAGVVDEVLSYRELLRQHREQVRSDRALSARQREEVLRTLSEETELSVVRALGPQAYKYYIRSGSGKWIWE